MLKKPLLSSLKSESKKIFKRFESEIVDILLFGSTIRGKSFPNDIDILIIFKKKKLFAVEQELRQSLQKKSTISVEVTSKSYNEIFQNTFLARESVLTEGYSLIFDNFLAESFGFKSMVLFSYELKGKSKSERMRFYYSLYGRNSEGMLKKLGAQKYSDSIILCPIENQNRMKEYLSGWVEFKETPILMPSRL